MTNILRSRRVESHEPCPRIEGAERVRTQFGGYLSDESRTTAEGVRILYLPDTIGQAAGALAECRAAGRTLSVAGARTGIVGGSVPMDSEAVLGLENLDHIQAIRYDADRDVFLTRVEAGVVLSSFQEALRTTPPHELPWVDERSRRQGERLMEESGQRLFYPVDPTETSAQVGGTVSTNASGARTFYYGATRNWVEGLTVVLASGEVLKLRRGECVAEGNDDGRFILEAQDGSRREVPIRELDLPSTKHQAGYYMSSFGGAEGIDAVDLFVGSEGTLGVIVEAELRLTFPPRERLFATAFLPSEDQAIRFVREARRRSAGRFCRGSADEGQEDEIRPVAIEYIGPEALDLLRDKREKEGASSGVPPLRDDVSSAVYVELAFDGDEEFRACYDVLDELLREAGSEPAETWAGFAPADLEGMKALRHAIPEHVNGIIGRRKRDIPSLHKVGTDMAVPDESLEEALSLYRSRLGELGLEHVIFGHVGDNHLHVNILPRSEQELERAMDVYREFATKVVKMGGSVAAEHGIGRIKKLFLPVQFDEEDLAAMRAVKNALDPDAILNPGVLF